MNEDLKYLRAIERDIGVISIINLHGDEPKVILEEVKVFLRDKLGLTYKIEKINWEGIETSNSDFWENLRSNSEQGITSVIISEDAPEDTDIQMDFMHFLRVLRPQPNYAPIVISEKAIAIGSNEHMRVASIEVE